MDKITTPMAILISGVLIALIIAFKDNSPKYSLASTSTDAYLLLNTRTGYVCYGNTFQATMKSLRNDKGYKSMRLCNE